LHAPRGPPGDQLPPRAVRSPGFSRCVPDTLKAGLQTDSCEGPCSSTTPGPTAPDPCHRIRALLRARALRYKPGVHRAIFCLLRWRAAVGGLPLGGTSGERRPPAESPLARRSRVPGRTARCCCRINGRCNRPAKQVLSGFPGQHRHSFAGRYAAVYALGLWPARGGGARPEDPETDGSG